MTRSARGASSPATGNARRSLASTPMLWSGSSVSSLMIGRVAAWTSPCRSGGVDGQFEREVDVGVGERRCDIAAEVSGGTLGVDHDGAVVDVLGGATDRAALAVEGQLRVSTAGDAGLVDRVGVVDTGDPQRRGDGRCPVATSGDEHVVEVGGRTVSLDREDAVTRGGEPVVGGHLERTLVTGGDVVVAARTNDLGGETRGLVVSAFRAHSHNWWRAVLQGRVPGSIPQRP